MSRQQIYDKHKKHLFSSVKNFYKEPVVLHEGKGCLVKDIEGTEYLDFFGGILTISVGHANDAVNEAVISQVQRLSHVSTLYPTVPMVELAEKLAQITPGNLQKCYFTASGTEADEGAVMMAQQATGNQELVALRHGYSGRSMLAQALTAHSNYRVMPTQVAAIKHAAAPYCYRCPYKLTYPTCKMACANDVQELIDTTTTGKVAGMLAEPILGVGGFVEPPKEYYQITSEIIRKHGGLFIADEVQTGFGRTGKMWGIEHSGVEPDMMTMAKGIANGFPLGVFITTAEVADCTDKPSISTFGGNPVSTAAAGATINYIEQQNLVTNASERGEELKDGLKKIQRRHPKTIGDVRGQGLMLGVELVADEEAMDRTPNTKAIDALFEETKKRGLLIGKGGRWGNVVRISPPLTCTADDVSQALKVLGESFSAMGAP